MRDKRRLTAAWKTAPSLSTTTSSVEAFSVIMGSRPDPSPTAPSKEPARLSEKAASCSRFRKTVLISAADMTSVNDVSAVRLVFIPLRKLAVAVKLEELSDLAESIGIEAEPMVFFDSEGELARTLEESPLVGRPGTSKVVALVPAVSNV